MTPEEGSQCLINSFCIAKCNLPEDIQDNKFHLCVSQMKIFRKLTGISSYERMSLILKTVCVCMNIYTFTESNLHSIHAQDL